MKDAILRLLMPNRYRKMHVFDENDRKATVIKTSDNSWRIAYVDEIEGYKGEGITLSELLSRSKK